MTNTWVGKPKGRATIYKHPLIKHAIVGNKGLGRVLGRFRFEGGYFSSLEEAKRYAEKFGVRND